MDILSGPQETEPMTQLLLNVQKGLYYQDQLQEHVKRMASGVELLLTVQVS